MRRAVAAVAILATVGTAGSAWAATEAELDQVSDQIDELSAEIEAAESARSEAGEEVLAAKARLDELRAEVQTAEAALAVIEDDISRGEAELVRVKESLDHFESALATTRLRVADTRESLSVQVVELYKNASVAGTRFLTFSDASQATVGFGYVDGAMGDSNRLLNQLDILEGEEERQQEILDDQRRRQEELLAELADKRSAQADEVDRIAGLQAEAQQVAAEAENVVASLSAEIARFEEHKEGLEADAAALEAELAARGSGGTGPSGALARPVPGAVTSPYGYRIHPIFGTQRLHTGWDLSAGSGEPIVASADGVVVSAGVRGGYGNATVIDHGGGIATLYAHQSSMAVGAGQTVSQGEVIGYVGCTGYCTGAHLHFEVRENGTPVDPSGYVG